MTEDQLQAECMTLTKNYFPFLHGLIWHVPNQVGTRSAIEAKKLQAMGVEPGVFDIHVFLANSFYIIELKVGNNRLSQLQERWRNRVCAEGARYAGTCYSVDEYKAALWANVLKPSLGWRMDEVYKKTHILCYKPTDLTYSYDDWCKFNKFDKRTVPTF